MTGIRFNPQSGQWIAVLDADPFNPSPVVGEGERLIVESGTLTNVAQNLLWALSERLVAENNATLPTLADAEHAAREALTRAALRAHVRSQGVVLPPSESES